MSPPAGHQEAGPLWTTDDARAETLSLKFKDAAKRRCGPVELNALADELAKDGWIERALLRDDGIQRFAIGQREKIKYFEVFFTPRETILPIKGAQAQLVPGTRVARGAGWSSGTCQSCKCCSFQWVGRSQSKDVKVQSNLQTDKQHRREMEKMR